MAKLTKAQRKAHAEAEAILTKDRLSDDEKQFVFENWHEGAEHINGAMGAFFTPYDLAADFGIDAQCSNGRMIDLCAGIGILSYFPHYRGQWGNDTPEIACIEANPRYVEVGKKLLPEGRWICADVFDWRSWWRDELDGAMFDVAISNPPFGTVKRQGTGPRYRGREFEFHVMDIASEIADRGVFIVPQQSAPFRYSGSQEFRRLETGRGIEFEQATGLYLDIGCGIDTAYYRDAWKDTSVLCEVVTVDFTEAREQREGNRWQALHGPTQTQTQTQADTMRATQLALF